MTLPVTSSSTQALPWQAGASVGRFTLLVPLAQGGMAEIWLARQTGLRGFEKLVVIKRMVSSLGSDPEYLEMFFSEARLAAALSHHHIVQIYDLGEHQGAPYIVMEYLDGEDLAAVRRTAQKQGNPIPDAYAVKYVSMAAEGLHYAHTRQGPDGNPLFIVHRDVSPQNLVATMDGGLKVVDFGIAKLASTATYSGKLKGKLAYMSPEQARGEELDGRADVFALGVVLFELLTRTRLTPKMNDLQLLDFMAGGRPFDLPTQRRPELAPALEAIVVKALARNREARFGSARELQDALEAWLVSQQQAVTANELRDWLRGVFAQRILERRRLIDAANQVEPSSPVEVQNLAQLARHGSDSSSRSSPGLRTVSTAPQKKKPVVAVGVAAAAALLLGALFLVVPRGSPAMQPQPPPTPPPLEPVAPPAPPAPPAPTRLGIDTVPGGAKLIVDGVERGEAPLSLRDLGVGSFELEASLEGYQPLKRRVQLQRPGDQLHLELALVPLPKPDKGKPAARKPAAKVMGKLSLRTTPWTQVYFGGRKLGDTPLLNEPLPAGRQMLKLVSPDTGAEQVIEVDIKANETTVKKLKL